MSNATDRTVFVEMEAIETVRKGNTQAIDLGIGVNAGTTNFAGTTVEVSLDQGVDVKVREVKSFASPGQVDVAGERAAGRENVDGARSLHLEDSSSR